MSKIDNVNNLIISSDKKMSDAMLQLNKNIRGICFIVDDNKIVGVITDGDIRRAILNNFTKNDLVSKFMNREFVSLPFNSSNEKIRNNLSSKIKYIPLINDNQEIVDIASFENYRTIPVMEPKLSENASLYVQECLETNWISSKGKYVNKFENEFSKVNDNLNALSVSNGTVALHLALVALGIKHGDEVLVPNFTFASCINAIIHSGAKPIIVDIEPDTWCIDHKLIKNLITKNTKAIMPVHLYGMPCNIEEILNIAHSCNLKVIEDCAEAIGSKWQGKPVGTFGEAATFSFFGNKTITTGEGGMIIFKDNKIYDKAKILRDHGMSVKKRYWHDHVGFNYRMTNLQAAVGYSQMEQFNNIINKKRSIAERYTANLSDLNGIKHLPGDTDKAYHSYWLYSLQLEERIDRDEVISKLLNRGIEARPVFYPLNEMAIYKSFITHNYFPISKIVSRSSLSLPSSLNLDNAQIDHICDTLKSTIS